MARQVRSCQANVNLEPTILEIVKANCESTSDYIRGLIIADLNARKLLTAEVHLRMMLGEDYDIIIEQMRELQKVTT